MTLRSDLIEIISRVAEANPKSPYEVAEAGVAAFDFIAARGKSLVASIDAMDRFHRELHRRGAENSAVRDAMAHEGVPEAVRESVMSLLSEKAT